MTVAAGSYAGAAGSVVVVLAGLFVDQHDVVRPQALHAYFNIFDLQADMMQAGAAARPRIMKVQVPVPCMPGKSSTMATIKVALTT